MDVVSSTMELGGPGKLLCMDFGDYGRSNLLIIKDRFSGLLRVYLTKNKTAESAIKVVERWSHTYGLPGEMEPRIWIAVTDKKRPGTMFPGKIHRMEQVSRDRPLCECGI